MQITGDCAHKSRHLQKIDICAHKSRHLQKIDICSHKSRHLQKIAIIAVFIVPQESKAPGQNHQLFYTRIKSAPKVRFFKSYSITYISKIED
ncbi:hypothetical protein MTBBW1_1200009 [Desulfamplus magnetovallimortis]|uniref:Uncharacterized protein n=1 Tax=Desulfamplus magnetovallimortis TaxID=1246637 RepID=A0A1W1H669_9BACT|nr:hypothetical protein MTBBW1_1200009 [Desulfamplus magnetovallimortis]